MNRIARFRALPFAFALTLTLTLSLPSGVQAAGTATGVMPVTAIVIDSCAVAAGPMAFGNYNPISGSAMDAVGLITATCSNGTSYSISLNEGIGTGASLATRKLTSLTGGTLDYGIYLDAGRTSTWGDGTGGTAKKTGTGNGLPQFINAYGRVSGGQTSSVGVYADTITVTLSY